jgi:UDP-N-acetylmuramyl pentapeptide phosphotransferase/UDP-N-acetylglucosamine-1-phosphate transferase
MVCANCFLISVLLVLTKKLYGLATMEISHGVQKLHTRSTPRVGELSFVIGLSTSWLTSTTEIKHIITPILIAGMPAFLFGLAEDVTKRVGALAMLLATMFSGLMALCLTDYSLNRIDIWGIDWILKYTPLSVVFISFAVGGVANAINIIDGFNGLASTMATLGFAGFALIAWSVGYLSLASAAIILAACLWIFFWVNWHFGKLFLGDGGSYFLGFALASGPACCLSSGTTKFRPSPLCFFASTPWWRFFTACTAAKCAIKIPVTPRGCTFTAWSSAASCNA